MSRERWLDAGLQALADHGPAGIKIDRLAPLVGLSKGSFFHHFAGVDDYRAALLRRWEVSALPADQDAPPADVLRSYAAAVDDLVDLRLDAAVRAWALVDETAAAAQERVDRARLARLQDVWSRLTDDADRARAAALLPHLLLVGAAMVRPTLGPDDLADVFGLLAELIPAATRPSNGPGASAGS